MKCGYSFKYTPKLLIGEDMLPFEDGALHTAAPELTYDSTTKSFTIAKCATGDQKNIDRDCSSGQETKIYTVVVEISNGDDNNEAF